MEEQEIVIHIEKSTPQKRGAQLVEKGFFDKLADVEKVSQKVRFSPRSCTWVPREGENAPSLQL